MNDKRKEPWEGLDEVDTVELTGAPGGAAGNKSITTQGGGDSDTDPSEPTEGSATGSGATPDAPQNVG